MLENAFEENLESSFVYQQDPTKKIIYNNGNHVELFIYAILNVIILLSSKFYD